MELYSNNSKIYLRRKLEIRKRVLIVSGIFLAVFLLLFLAAWGILKMSFFEVRSVDILGVSSQSKDKLMADIQKFSSDRYLIPKIFGYDNIASWNIREADFLKEHPEYESFLVDRDFWEHKVLINAKEREKFGLWCRKEYTSDPVKEAVLDVGIEQSQPDEIATGTDAVKEEAESDGGTALAGEYGDSERCWWFDRKGVVFSSAPAIESELFRRVEDSYSREIRLGEALLPSDQLDNLLKIYDILGSAGINSNTLYLSDYSLQEATVRSLTDPDIYFSIRYDPGFAVFAIEDLKKKGKWSGVEYVDLRVPGRVYYR